MKARAKTGTTSRPAREPVVESISDAEKRRPFLASGDTAQLVMMRVSDESDIGLTFDLTNGAIGEVDLDDDEDWTFDRYLTESESVQIIGG